MPTLVMVGVSHHAAPLAVRERVALDESRWRELATASNLHAVVLSTCNRVELYAWAEARPAQLARRLQRSLARLAGLSLAELQPYLLTCTGRDALLHLVRVAAGLDSLVVGEDQIRGQVRDALRQAEAASALPAPLRGVFQRALESARRVRGSTRLAKLPSIAAAGVHAARHLLPANPDGQTIVILGAGVMARAAADSAVHLGARLRILSRTPQHAIELARRYGALASGGSLDELPDAMRDAALIVGATASSRPIVTAEALAEATQQRRSPLVLLDIAVPRDIDPAARDLATVRLIDLDDLERECPLDVVARRAELERAEVLANQEVDRLAEWLHIRAVSPAISELRSYAETIRLRELRRSAPRLKDLTPDQAAAVDALTTGIVQKLLHGPTVALRDAATRPRSLRQSHSRILRVVRPARGRTA